MEYPIPVTFRCETELERLIRIEAAKLDMNRSQFILTALREKLERLGVDTKVSQDTAKPNA